MSEVLSALRAEDECRVALASKEEK
jgi:hypothetical protein